MFGIGITVRAIEGGVEVVAVFDGLEPLDAGALRLMMRLLACFLCLPLPFMGSSVLGSCSCFAASFSFFIFFPSLVFSLKAGVEIIGYGRGADQLRSRSADQ